MNYYNDSDPYVAQWTRNLMAAGHLPAGTMDARPLEEITYADLAGYTQHHFFNGIGGWPYALTLAGWPATRPVWTASCPCQPFSIAGKQRGIADERHLWPVLFRLIREYRPDILFGEQVSSPAGREWFAGVHTDLESVGYRVGAAGLCAAGVAAPHLRQRLYWVADTHSTGWPEREGERGHNGAQQPTIERSGGHVARVGFPHSAGWDTGESSCETPRYRNTTESTGRWSHWDDYEYVSDSNGTTRRVRPSLPMLAHGVPHRVAQLRAYGNAIVPQVAATFIHAYLLSEREPCD